MIDRRMRIQIIDGIKELEFISVNRPRPFNFIAVDNLIGYRDAAIVQKSIYPQIGSIKILKVDLVAISGFRNMDAIISNLIVGFAVFSTS